MRSWRCNKVNKQWDKKAITKVLPYKKCKTLTNLGWFFEQSSHISRSQSWHLNLANWPHWEHRCSTSLSIDRFVTQKFVCNAEIYMSKQQQQHGSEQPKLIKKITLNSFEASHNRVQQCYYWTGFSHQITPISIWYSSRSLTLRKILTYRVSIFKSNSNGAIKQDKSPFKILKICKLSSYDFT